MRSLPPRPLIVSAPAVPVRSSARGVPVTVWATTTPGKASRAMMMRAAARRDMPGKDARARRASQPHTRSSHGLLMEREDSLRADVANAAAAGDPRSSAQPSDRRTSQHARSQVIHRRRRGARHHPAEPRSPRPSRVVQAARTCAGRTPPTTSTATRATTASTASPATTSSSVAPATTASSAVAATTPSAACRATTGSTAARATTPSSATPTAPAT